MALNKIDAISLGRSNLTNNTDATVIFTSNNIIEVWSIATNYAQYNVIEYSGKIYRSKIAGNLANTPSSSPAQWETLYSAPKNGDICFVIGANATIMQRSNGIWGNVSDAIVTLALVDGQVAPAAAVIFLGSFKAKAEISYTIRRGSGHGRKREGKFTILNDTLGSLDYRHEFGEIGIDTNVWLTPVMVGANVEIQYTSAAEAVAIELKYSLRGWT